MSTVDFSVLDLPRSEVVEDPQAYLRAAVQWHFSSATGSPYWLRRAKSLGFDPLTDVKSPQGTARGRRHRGYSKVVGPPGRPNG
jgi:hypothetical protein